MKIINKTHIVSSMNTRTQKFTALALILILGLLPLRASFANTEMPMHDMQNMQIDMPIYFLICLFTILFTLLFTDDIDRELENEKNQNT